MDNPERRTRLPTACRPDNWADDVDPAPDTDGTITLEQWRALRAVHQAPLPDPPADIPDPPPRRSWADTLEQKARRCRGCGEWTFTEWCDWCEEVRPQ